jgi:hypothetical protein
MLPFVHLFGMDISSDFIQVFLLSNFFLRAQCPVPISEEKTFITATTPKQTTYGKQ